MKWKLQERGCLLDAANNLSAESYVGKEDGSRRKASTGIRVCQVHQLRSFPSQLIFDVRNRDGGRRRRTFEVVEVNEKNRKQEAK